ncbi:MAG: hypothetical protein WC244_00305 [Patescibacteria group bacterium]|jgi:hypothetical protein
MGRFWKHEKSNHHFPELNPKKGFGSLAACFLCGMKGTSLVVVITVLVGVAYLMQTNITATKGYQVNDLQRQLSDLQEVSTKLNLNYIQLQSMANIVNGASKSDLVPISRVEVISPVGSIVAMK